MGNGLTGGWHISRGGATYGPYTWSDLVAWAQAGRLSPDDLVWEAQLPGWMPARQVAGLFPAIAAAVSTPAGTAWSGRPGSGVAREAAPLDLSQIWREDPLSSHRDPTLTIDGKRPSDQTTRNVVGGLAALVFGGATAAAARRGKWGLVALLVGILVVGAVICALYATGVL